MPKPIFQVLRTIPFDKVDIEVITGMEHPDISNTVLLLFFFQQFSQKLRRTKVEASLIVPDFTISVFGSSCNFLFFYHFCVWQFM